MKAGQISKEIFDNYIKIFNNLYSRPVGTSPGGLSPAEWDAQAWPLRCTPADTPFRDPDWRVILCRQEPAMSDPAYEQAIILQAQQDCAVGRFADSASYDLLSRSFLQCVSPDRRALYRQSMARTQGKMNAANAIFDRNKRSVMKWNEDEESWITVLTSRENARSRIFGDIYSTAWNECNAKRESVERPTGGASA